MSEALGLADRVRLYCPPVYCQFFEFASKRTVSLYTPSFQHKEAEKKEMYPFPTVYTSCVF